MSAPDPWAFQRWAFGTTTGNPVRKAVLSYLAMTASAETGRCEAKQGSIAAAVECSERTVREHLAALVEQRLIARRAQYRRDRGRRNDEFLLLAPWVDEWPDGEAVPPRQDPPTPPAGPGTPPGVSDSPGKNDHPGTTTSEQPLSERARASERDDDGPKPLSYRGRRVPAEVAANVDRLLAVFAEASGQRRSSQQARKQVVGALMARPDVDIAMWEAGVRAIIASPPDWWDGPPEIGHVFGERAADWTLRAASRPASPPAAGAPGGSARTSTMDHYAAMAARFAAEEGEVAP